MRVYLYYVGYKMVQALLGHSSLNTVYLYYVGYKSESERMETFQ